MVVSYKGDGNTEDQEKKKTQSIHHCYYAVFLTKNRKHKKKAHTMWALGYIHKCHTGTLMTTFLIGMDFPAAHLGLWTSSGPTTM